MILYFPIDYSNKRTFIMSVLNGRRTRSQAMAANPWPQNQLDTHVTANPTKTVITSKTLNIRKNLAFLKFLLNILTRAKRRLRRTIAK